MMISKEATQDIKDLEINSLLDLSKTINENKSVEDLFNHYGRLMNAAIKIEKLALFVRDSDWKCEVNFGSSDSLAGKVAHPKILELKEECQILTGFISDTYDSFSLVLPINHKDEIHAFLLLGGFDEDDDLPLFLDLPFVRTFTNILVVAIENKRLAEREKQKILFDREMWIAKEVQMNLIPKSFPDTEKLKIQAKYLPHTQIGGDYYDFVESDNGIHICLADVSGKGVPAALFMSNVQAIFRVLVRQGLGLEEIILELNRILLHNGKGSLYVSVIMAFYNRKRKALTYINAGHLPGLCLVNGTITLMDKGTTVLGEFEELPFLEKAEIKAQDVKILLYTDGLSEARNPEGEEYGMERILSVFKKESDKDPNTQISKIMDSLDDFRKNIPLPDDLTLLCCHIKE